MNHVLAKVKKLKPIPYGKLISNETLFESIDLTTISLIDFSPDHKLDDDSWFQIEDFSKTKFCPSEVIPDLDVKDLTQLSAGHFDNIQALVSVQEDDLYFQKVTASNFIKKKTIYLGESAQVEEGRNRLVIKTKPDAIYYKSKDTFIFRDLSSISSLFPGITEIYKEATDEDVANFLKSDFINLSEQYDKTRVSIPNRKRLALVVDTLKKMKKSQRDKLITYVKDYCGDKISLATNNSQFKIETDEHLKYVLYGIEERFYTTEGSKQKRLANSVEILQ